MRVLVGVIAVALAASASPSHAGKLSAADKTWIEACVAGRKGNDRPSALRKYCACMHEIVEDNRPFGVTELERAYPPAHRMCWRKAGLRSN